VWPRFIAWELNDARERVGFFWGFGRYIDGATEQRLRALRSRSATHAGSPAIAIALASDKIHRDAPNASAKLADSVLDVNDPPRNAVTVLFI
jgi:hypothetical protein